ncbi:hypothetical protein C8A00DRAFT_17670, partial [Chaetomidium leptoderma]
MSAARFRWARNKSSAHSTTRVSPPRSPPFSALFSPLSPPPTSQLCATAASVAGTLQQRPSTSDTRPLHLPVVPLPALSSPPLSQAPHPSHDAPVACDTIQSEGGNDDTEVEPQESPSVSSGPAATPAIGRLENGDAWQCSKPVPGSRKNKLIYPRAPFEWGSWTGEQWNCRARFVQKALAALVDEHLGLENPPVYSPHMVGRCPSDAHPTIVVFCRKVDFKCVRNLFRKRATLPLCLEEESAMFFRASQRAENNTSGLPPLRLAYYRATT